MTMNLYNNNNSTHHARRKTHDASVVMASLLLGLFLCFCHVGQVASFNSVNVQVVGPGAGGMRSIDSIRSVATTASSPRSQQLQQQQQQQLQRRRGRRITSQNIFLLYDSKSKDNTNEEDTKEKEEEKEMDLLTKSSWYAVEWFGKAFGSNNKNKDNGGNKSSGIVDTTQPPKSITETLKRIQLDNDNAYFLNGQMDTLIYDEDCVFADPFVSFEGRDRFVDNLSNLGSFITKYDCMVLKNKDSKVKEDPAATTTCTTTTTRFMVKLELNLPWRPILAWPWGVTYEIDPDTCLVTKHTESWEIEPWEGVKQIFRKPTTTV